MQLTNTQIQALSNVSNLDLQSNSYILRNEITNLPRLLNAIAVSKTALNNNIKLPLSKTETTEIYNQITKTPYVYPSDLKCKYTRGSFHTTVTLPQIDDESIDLYTKTKNTGYLTTSDIHKTLSNKLDNQQFKITKDIKTNSLNVTADASILGFEKNGTKVVNGKIHIELTYDLKNTLDYLSAYYNDDVLHKIANMPDKTRIYNKEWTVYVSNRYITNFTANITTDKSITLTDFNWIEGITAIFEPKVSDYFKQINLDVYSYYSTNMPHILSDQNLAEVQALMTLLNINSLFNKKICLPYREIKPLLQLIYLQQLELKHKINVDIDKTLINTADFSDAVKQFISNYHMSDKTLNIKFTFSELIEYMINIVKGKPISSKMFKLITNQKSNIDSASDIIINEIKTNHLEHKLRFANDDEKQNIMKRLPREVRPIVAKIYVIDDKTDLSQYQHIIPLLAHGTDNGSIISILKNGLLDPKTLRKQKNKHYRYTSNALGNGIYFTKLKHCQKSVNFANQYIDINTYMFLAEVGYNTRYDTSVFEYDKTHSDLVYAHKVSSHNRDEIVAKSGKQVKLRYLLELEKKEYYY